MENEAEIHADVPQEENKPETTAETVTLRHPGTGDEQVVPAVSEELIPWMGKGYAQVKGDSNAV